MRLATLGSLTALLLSCEPGSPLVGSWCQSNDVTTCARTMTVTRGTTDDTVVAHVVGDSWDCTFHVTLAAPGSGAGTFSECVVCGDATVATATFEHGTLAIDPMGHAVLGGAVVFTGASVPATDCTEPVDSTVSLNYDRQ
jgi:hypothetical protein